MITTIGELATKNTYDKFVDDCITMFGKILEDGYYYLSDNETKIVPVEELPETMKLGGVQSFDFDLIKTFVVETQSIPKLPKYSEQPNPILQRTIQRLQSEM